LLHGLTCSQDPAELHLLTAAAGKVAPRPSCQLLPQPPPVPSTPRNTNRLIRKTTQIPGSNSPPAAAEAALPGRHLSSSCSSHRTICMAAWGCRGAGSMIRITRTNAFAWTVVHVHALILYRWSSRSRSRPTPFMAPVLRHDYTDESTCIFQFWMLALTLSLTVSSIPRRFWMVQIPCSFSLGSQNSIPLI
jgi:hypothetical protein